MPSFDIVSKVDMAEVDNAVNGMKREMDNRFDFKGSNCSVERDGEEIVLLADDDMKLRQMQEMLKGYATKRSIDAGAMEFQTPEAAAGQSQRQRVTVRQGISAELAKKIVKSIKGTKMKVQVAIQGDELRVSGKKRDDLQDAIAHVKDMGLDQPTQYVNFRD